MPTMVVRPYRSIKMYGGYFGSIYRRDEVDYTVERIGAERVLFGTDMTGSYLVNYGQMEEADLTPEERELIYYKNAIKVLNLRDWR